MASPRHHRVTEPWSMTGSRLLPLFRVNSSSIQQYMYAFTVPSLGLFPHIPDVPSTLLGPTLFSSVVNHLTLGMKGSRVGPATCSHRAKILYSQRDQCFMSL